MSVMKTFLRLPLRDHCLFVEAAILTGIARVVILVLPFRWIAPWIGTQVSGDSAEADGDDSQKELLRRVRWAVEAASRRVPWQSLCLVQAMTARSMLRRRGRSGIVYFGLAKDDEKDLLAHAWLRSGGLIISGNCELRKYTTVSAFAFGTMVTAAESPN